jgi:hypothetical protein
MPATYVRRFSLKASLSDVEVAAYWTFLLEEAMPAMQKVAGVRSVKLYSGAGGLRTDLRAVIDMDDASVYERILLDPVESKYSKRSEETAGNLPLQGQIANLPFLRMLLTTPHEREYGASPGVNEYEARMMAGPYPWRRGAFGFFD